jgi:thiol-disulfide isomerase/thioredoxin
MQSFPHKWKFNILSKNKIYTAYGTFQFFNDNILPHLSGSIATPYGDLGHLSGFIKNDSVFLSVFNGSFATYLAGKLFYSTQQKLDSIQGYIYYGSWGVEKFSAIPVSDISMKNQIQLNEIFNPTSFILNVNWKDIYNQPITIEKNKPLILLLMGTWCPNCTDENKLFTEWYSQLSFKVQIIALAVERTNNSNKAIQLLQNYKTKLNIPYPIVLLSEKGNQAPFEIFPQLIKIPAFPTTIYFNKELKPVFATMGFNGPATNELYLQTQQHIKDIIQQLQ